MNCDTAFDLMTDADGARSLALANHLADCPRCRQMQETLAPALEFLTPGKSTESAENFASHFTTGSGSTGREPLVTAQALRIARDAATTLASLSETPQERWRRLTGSSLRYAAVFAAGLLLAFTFFDSRPAAPRAKDCTRHEVLSDGQSRSTAEIRVLAISCAACHDGHSKLSDPQPTSSLSPRQARDAAWLHELLREDTLVASEDWHHGAAVKELG